jgi:hypothetical protein
MWRATIKRHTLWRSRNIQNTIFILWVCFSDTEIIIAGGFYEYSSLDLVEKYNIITGDWISLEIKIAYNSHYFSKAWLFSIFCNFIDWDIQFITYKSQIVEAHPNIFTDAGQKRDLHAEPGIKPRHAVQQALVTYVNNVTSYFHFASKGWNIFSLPNSSKILKKINLLTYYMT